MPGEYDFDNGVSYAKNKIKSEIREILDNIYNNGELEAGLGMLEELSDYKP